MAAQGQDIVPLIGARRPDRLEEALGALNLTLTPADLTELDQIIPKGAATQAMQNLNLALGLDELASIPH